MGKPANRNKRFNATAFLKSESETRNMMAPIAMLLAIECCKMGHSALEASTIIELTPEQLESLMLWYAAWSKED